MGLEFSGQIFRKSPQIWNFLKIRPVGAELFHAGGRPGERDDADIRFSPFCERAQKIAPQCIKLS
jgi:hypothetical protein